MQTNLLFLNCVDIVLYCQMMPWLTVRGWVRRPCGSRTRHVALQCWDAVSAAGCPPPSQSPLSARRACWPDSAASWWTWRHIQCLKSSLYSVWQLQTAHCRHKRRKKKRRHWHYLMWQINKKKNYPDDIFHHGLCWVLWSLSLVLGIIFQSREQFLMKVSTINNRM